MARARHARWDHGDRKASFRAEKNLGTGEYAGCGHSRSRDPCSPNVLKSSNCDPSLPLSQSHLAKLPKHTPSASYSHESKPKDGATRTLTWKRRWLWEVASRTPILRECSASKCRRRSPNLRGARTHRDTHTSASGCKKQAPFPSKPCQV